VRRLIFILIIGILLFGFGTAIAATSGFDNIPGGAGVFMWQASRNGDYTLVNIQNAADVPDSFGGADSTAVVIHITLYDRDSNHIFDWSCPLSVRDNYGFVIMNEGGADAIAILNDGTPFYTTSIGGVGNCTINYTAIPATHNPATGATALQYGYGTIAITRIDAEIATDLWRTNNVPNPNCFPPDGDNNGDARNEVDMANYTVCLPDLVFARTAMLGAGYAFALNANMLQGFMNCSRLQPENVDSVSATTAAGCGWLAVQGVDAMCTSDIDWDNTFTFRGASVALPDFNGIDIHSPELYITNNWTTDTGGDRIGIAMDVAGAANCTRANRRNALGSADGVYWGRYNATPGLTDTTLITIAPASSAHALNPASGIADTRNLIVSSYDDKEIPISVTPILPPEVGMSPFLSATNAPRPGNVSIGHGGVTAGEARIVATSTYLPLYGYTFTTISGAVADMYPLIKNRQAVNILDLATGSPIPDGAGIHNIEYVGF
jgi:hypothetical protein